MEHINMAQAQPDHHAVMVGQAQQLLHVTGIKDAAPKWSVFAIPKFNRMVMVKRGLTCLVRKISRFCTLLECFPEATITHDKFALSCLLQGPEI
jgi:hypothetical protein